MSIEILFKRKHLIKQNVSYRLCIYFRKLLGIIKKLNFRIFSFSLSGVISEVIKIDRTGGRFLRRKNSRRKRNFGAGIKCCEDPSEMIDERNWNERSSEAELRVFARPA